MDYQDRTTERAHRLEAFGGAYVTLTEALKQFPPDMWQWKAGQDGWSIHEVILHVADAEANGYVRCRRLIAEPGSSVMAYDENRWTAALSYHDQSFADALELFRWLRVTTYKLLRAQPEAIWANTIEHPTSGTLNLDNWLATYTSHLDAHIEQMREIHQQWRAQQERG